MKLPLELKGMIRYCHPPTPMVGLYRQSNDPERTRQSYILAIRKRDLCYFPTMLRTMTRRTQSYRLIQRLWIKAIQKVLRHTQCYLIPVIMESLQMERVETIGTYFTKYHELHLPYDSLNAPLRFQQMAGRLVTLGYPFRPLVEVDCEYEYYLSKFPPDTHPQITDLYRQLCQKGIPQKWHIVLSYLPRHLHYNLDDWNYAISSNRLALMLQAFHRQHHLSIQEYQLMVHWIERMKYPSD